MQLLWTRSEMSITAALSQTKPLQALGIPVIGVLAGVWRCTRLAAAEAVAAALSVLRCCAAGGGGRCRRGRAGGRAACPHCGSGESRRGRAFNGATPGGRDDHTAGCGGGGISRGKWLACGVSV
jgi:hypothetical protein